MTGRCWMCGRRRGPSPDGLGSHCRRKLTTHRTTRPADRPGHTQPALEEITVTTETRPAGYHRAALINALDGGMCDDCDSTCPRCEKARALVDNHAAEVLDQAADKLELIGYADAARMLRGDIPF